MLKDRHLLDHFFSVATDNAANDDTLIQALQESLSLSDDFAARADVSGRKARMAPTNFDTTSNSKRRTFKMQKCLEKYSRTLYTSIPIRLLIGSGKRDKPRPDSGVYYNLTGDLPPSQSHPATIMASTVVTMV